MKKESAGYRTLAAGQNDTIALFIEIYINLPLFRKYVEIYYFLGTKIGEFEFSIVLKFHEIFFELMELEFHKFEFQKGDRSPTYFQNNGRLIYISANNGIWPFWP